MEVPGSFLCLILASYCLFSPVKVFIYDNRPSFFSIDLIDICDLHPGNKEQHGTRFCGTVDYIEKVILGTLKNQKNSTFLGAEFPNKLVVLHSVTHSSP